MVPDTERNDEITLAELLRPIHRFLSEINRPLLRISIACAIVAAIAVSLTPKYEANALLDAPDLSLDEWRAVKPLLRDRVLLDAYFASQKGTMGDELATNLARRLASERYWDQQAQFRTSLQRGDEKIAPNAQVAKTSTLGIELSLNVQSQETGLAQLRGIAGYIQSTLHWVYLKRYIQSLTQEVDRLRTEIDADMVRQDFAIEQNTRRIAEMKRLLTQYPESRRLETNSVLSVEGGGGKFLSPIAQLVALETTISDANAAKRTAQRELEKLDWKIKYAREIAGSYDKFHTGSALDAFLTDSLKKVYVQGSAPSSAALEEYYDISIKLTGIRQRAELFVFKSSPNISDSPVRARNPYLVGSMAFAVSYVFLALVFWVHRRSTTAGALWDSATDPWFRRLPAAFRRWLFGR